MIELLFKANGRISRRKYFILLIVFPFAAIFILISIIKIYISPTNDYAVKFVNEYFLHISQLIMILSVLCISIKRLHDINKSGWWLLFYFIGLFAFRNLAIYINKYLTINTVVVTDTLTSLIFFWACAELILCKGDSHENRFGLPPQR